MERDARKKQGAQKLPARIRLVASLLLEARQ